MPLLRRPGQSKKQSQSKTSMHNATNGTSRPPPRPSAPPRPGRQNSLPGPPFPHVQNTPAGQVVTASQTTYFTHTTYALPLPPPANNPHPIYPAPQSHPQQLIQQRPWASAVNLPGAISQTLHDAGDLAYDLHDQWLGGPLPPMPGITSSLFQTLGFKFNDVITAIDDGTFSGKRNDLNVTYEEPIPVQDPGHVIAPAPAPPSTALVPVKSPTKPKKKPTAANRRTVTKNYFDKVYLYMNSRLPPGLPPLKLRPKAYPLLCLAAQYSRRAYEKPSAQERQHHISADWRMGTKAMVIKSVALDRADAIVFAIRGTQSFRDWATNIKTEPTSPYGFLDDAGNLCHAGFLSVARKMISPVATRLRDLIREDPNRAASSLVITGHSAGGAVAALLFCHMYSESVQSDLTDLRGLFKRVHCITFGAPPVTLRPLQKPASARGDPTVDTAMFLSFLNEGDPVTRADLTYVRSLLELYASPAPGSKFHALIPYMQSNTTPVGGAAAVVSSGGGGKKQAKTKAKKEYTWKVPQALLANAGTLVVLRLRNTGNTAATGRSRKHSLDSTTMTNKQQQNGGRSASHTRSRSSGSSGHGHGKKRKVEACLTTDAQLRGIVFGDPMMHQMDVYADRVERLAKEEGIAVPVLE